METTLNRKKPERNNAIDLFRLFSAITVVLSHSHVFLDINETAYQIVAEFIPRFTVPFFFCTSGFFMIKALLQGRNVFPKMIKAVLRTYVVWTFIYYIVSFVINVVLSDVPLEKFLVERVVYFFGEGSYPHFWYFPALIYSLIAVTLVIKFFGEAGIRIFAIAAIVLYLIGALGTAYWDIGRHIPVLADIYDMDSFGVIRGIVCMGFAYFSLGYWLIVLEDKIMSAKKSICHWLMIVSILTYLGEIILLVVVLHWVERPELMFSTYLMTGLIFVVLLKHPLPRMARFAGNARILANFTYYIHPLLVLGYPMFAQMLGFNIGSLLLFAVVVITSLLIGYVFLKWDSGIARLLLGERQIRRKRSKAGKREAHHAGHRTE